MKNFEILEKLELQLSSGQAENKSFEEICMAMSLSPEKVDMCLRETFGLGGEVLCECYRKDIPACLVSGGSLTPAAFLQPR